MPPATLQEALTLAVQHHRAGRLGEAEVLLREILAAQPNHAEAWHRLGVIALQVGRRDLGIEWVRRSTSLNPNNHIAHFNLGEAFRAGDQLEEAEACYRRALVLQPDYAEAHYQLGRIFAKQGRLDAAMAAFRAAIQSKPDFALAILQLGDALRDQLRLEEAGECYERAVAVGPQIAGAHVNLGMIRSLQGRLAEEEVCYRQAIARQADSATAHLNLGILLLLLGRFEEGWQEYEWRWQTPADVIRLQEISLPRWDGTPLEGKTLLIHAEQGYGDTLQFLRYLPFVRDHARARRLIFRCPRALFPLVRQVAQAGLEVVPSGPAGGAARDIDFQIPLLSLPLVLRRFEPVPMTTPYLRADSHLCARWRERLGAAGGKVRVGLAWTGNPKFAMNRVREIAPEDLTPILSVPGIQWVSLQVYPRQPLPPALAAANVLDFTPHIADFADSAALLAELDLVITVDTAVAHLAGALGCPVWVLLYHCPDWRWGLEREDSPWYPTARLFRQSQRGTWPKVLERVAIALREWPAKIA